jgi:localization factor PodJL
MRPDLPWNVAGIPPEAREAARAAARREGLSVGEWLTRRILRSFADAGDEDELTRDSLATRTYDADPADAHDRETTEALDRASRSGQELKDVYRRIEEQLRGVARRMDTAERSQSENNRAMSKAATEMNIASREQTQAFDQLGAHVVGLADRIERVERANAQNGMKDAVKGLHAGLSRLADQITQNATQSATQIGALADNLETVAGRLSEARNDADGALRSFESRMAALDDRIYLVEKAAQNTSSALERALEKLDAHAAEQPQAARREAETSDAIARLEENFAKLEARGPDPLIEKRLDGIDKNLGDLIERLDGNEPTTARAIEDSLKRLLNRVEATENRQRDTVSEFRTALGDTTARLAAIEAKVTAAAVLPPPPPAVQAAPAFTPLPPSYDSPPFPDTPTPGAPPPFAAQPDPFAPAPAFDAPPPFPAEDPFAPAQAGDAFAAAQPAAGDSFLSAARRSARAAATAAEAEQTSRGFAWNTTGKIDTGPKEGGSRTPYVIIGLVVLVVVALIAAFALSQGLLGSSSHPQGLGSLFAPKAAPAPQPQSEAGTPLHAVAPDAGDTAPPATATQPKTTTKPAVLPPLQQKQVNAAPVHTVPQQPQQTQPAQNQQAQQQQLNVVVPTLDRVTQLANAGNAKAQTIIGLKYLNGEGRPVNEAEAAKWLERAAEAGEPVAQYRLGTLYEHGSGVPADAAKATHWYLAAAMQGNRKAMHNIAVDYAEGTGIKKDPTEAARWFSKAASLGLVDSQFNLAVLYERGTGVPQSLIDAYKWYAIAASGGDKESKSRIDALGTQLSTDDRAAAQHAADAFKPSLPDARANVAPQQGEL